MCYYEYMNDLMPKIQEEYKLVLEKDGVPSLASVKNLKKRVFLETYWAVRGNVTKSCKAARISRYTFYQWQKKDPRFRAFLLEQQAQLCDSLEGELLDRAIDKANDTALIFALKNVHPRYKPQKETVAVSGDDVKFVITRG